ncbi:MAG: hypothetical protein Fur0018_02690 [Anaerolineales bacterium]
MDFAKLSLQHNPNPVMLFNADGNLKEANPTGKKLLGLIGYILPQAWMEAIRFVAQKKQPRNILTIAEKQVYALQFLPVPDGDNILCYGYETTDITQTNQHNLFYAQLGRAIGEISARFTDPETYALDEAIPEALKTLGELLHASSVALFQSAENGAALFHTHAWYGKNAVRLPDSPWHQKDFPHWWQMLLTGQPITILSTAALINDAGEEFLPWRNRGVKSIIAVPHLREERIHSLLLFENPTNRDIWRDTAGAYLKILGNLFANAIARQRDLAVLRSQRDFATLVMRTMGQGLTVTDTRGRLQYVNPAFTQLIGASAAVLLGKDAQALVHPDDRETYHRTLVQRTAGEKTVYEVRLLRADGRPLPVLITSVLYRRDGALAGSIAVITDLSERKRAEALLRAQNEELEQARDRALEAARLKSEFLATMSHEIRTPMNSILGMAELLLESDLDEQRKDFAQTIAQSTQRLLDTINDILDFSRLESGDFQLESAPFSPATLVEEVAAAFASQARQKSLSLMTSIAPQVPSMLAGDARHLRRVLTNLVNNAVKFTESGEVNIYLSAFPSGSQTVTLECRVQDTGIGILPEQRSRIFQPFTQTDGSLTRRYEGSGLGLAMCRQIIEKMGGEINFESAPGSGSVFWFRVPLGLPGTAAGESVPPIEKFLEGRRVLLVEDSPTSRQIILQYLQTWGAQTANLPDGRDVLITMQQAAARGEPFHMALLDLRLPDTDGVTLAGQILADAALQNTPLVLITAHDTPGQGEQALQAGFRAYLSKPIRQRELYNTLQDLAQQAAAPAAVTAGTKILIIEDNPANRKMVLLQLKALGYPAEAVDHALEGIRRLQDTDGHYALILMDVQMPEMDGLMATRQIRTWESTHGGHIPIVALTANAMSGDRERCLEAGMDDYLSKPLRKADLQAVLQKWLPPECRPQADSPAASPEPGTESPPAEARSPQPPAETPHEDLLDPATLETLRQLEESTEPGMRRELYSLYLEHSAQTLAAVLQAIQKQEAEALRQSAHSLKGSSMEVGAHKLGRLCAELEKIGRSGDASPAASRQAALESLYAATRRAIQEMLAGLPRLSPPTPKT